MPTYNIVAETTDIIDRMVSEGLLVTRYKMLPLHATVICDEVALNDYQLTSCSECKGTLAPSVADDIAIPASFDGDGCWALARICRRRTPWDVTHVVHPISTSYEYVLDGSGVDVYVLDSGIDLAHTELQGTYVENVYEYYSSGGLGDDNGHGTLVAGAIIGTTLGCAKGAHLFGFKSANVVGNTDASLISTISEVLDHYSSRSGLGRPAVCSLSINPSHGGGVSSAIAAMIDVGIVCTISLGNDKDDSAASAVAATADIIGVGGIGFADLPYWVNTDGTQYGVEVDVLSPSQSLKVASATVRAAGTYEVRRGTSLGCPYVSGVIACMLQGHGRLTTRSEVQAVRSYLLSQATVGRRRLAFGYSDLPDRVVYLNPKKTFHNIF